MKCWWRRWLHSMKGCRGQVTDSYFAKGTLLADGTKFSVDVDYAKAELENNVQ